MSDKKDTKEEKPKSEAKEEKPTKKVNRLTRREALVIIDNELTELDNMVRTRHCSESIADRTRHILKGVRAKFEEFDA